MSESVTEAAFRGPPGTARPETRNVALPSLTGLRFIAALAVFVCHTSALHNTIAPFRPVVPFAAADLATIYNKIAFNGGFVGVSFFFVLSGFVLTWSTRPTESKQAFWRRRLLKIYPNHLVTFTVSMILFAAAITPVSQWLATLLLVQSWSLNAPTRWAVNSPSWSLCCELVFYMLFPFIIRPLRRIAENRLWAWVGGLFAAMLAVALINYLAIPSLIHDPLATSSNTPATGPTSATGPQYWFGYFLPPARLFEFVLGIVLARIVLAGRWVRFGVTPAAALTVTAYVLTIFLPAVFVFNVATVLPLGLLICAVAAADIRGVGQGLRSRTWQWLGEVSFAFYMCQGIVLLWGRKAMNGSQYSVLIGIALLLGFFVANMVAAAFLYTCVERPIMRKWSRRSPALAGLAIPASATRRPGLHRYQTSPSDFYQSARPTSRHGNPAKSATRDQ
jgi:peptidoglycan/LPS O-acetylase OafA/YrhL